MHEPSAGAAPRSAAPPGRAIEGALWFLGGAAPAFLLALWALRSWAGAAPAVALGASGAAAAVLGALAVRFRRRLREIAGFVAWIVYLFFRLLLGLFLDV